MVRLVVLSLFTELSITGVRGAFVVAVAA